MKEYLDSGKVKNWKVQEDGSLVVWVRISKAGALKYGDVTEYVDSETLFNTNSLESLVGIPACLEHPPTVFIRDLKQRQTYQKGCTLQEVIRERLDSGEEALTVATVVFDNGLKNQIMSGEIKEVSAAYRADSKVIDGKPTQRGRLYNHIAFTEAGRAGADVKVLINEEKPVGKEDKADSTVVTTEPPTTAPVLTPEQIRKQLVEEINSANALLKKFNSDIAYTPGDDLVKLKRTLLSKVTGKDASKYSEAELNIALDVLPEYKAPATEQAPESKPEPAEEKTDSVVAVEPKVEVYNSVNASDGFPANVIRSAEITKAQAEQAKRISEAWKIGLPPEIVANY